jgi:hypothetical protein
MMRNVTVRRQQEDVRLSRYMIDYDDSTIAWEGNGMGYARVDD